MVIQAWVYPNQACWDPRLPLLTVQSGFLESLFFILGRLFVLFSLLKLLSEIK